MDANAGPASGRGMDHVMGLLETPRNHNDLNLALHLVEQVAPDKTLLTHVGHTLDEYLMLSPLLPEGVEVAWDGRIARP